MCYDMSRPETCKNIYNEDDSFSWYDSVKKTVPQAKIIFVGCKSDIDDNSIECIDCRGCTV